MSEPMSQTPDIVERLRQHAKDWATVEHGAQWSAEHIEAADTITQLRERLDAVEKERDQLRLDNEGLRRTLLELRRLYASEASGEIARIVNQALTPTGESGTEGKG